MRAAKHGALLCVIFGVHLLLFRLIDVGDGSRSAHRSEEDFVTIMLVDLSKPDDTQPSTHSSSKRPMSTYDPSLQSGAAPNNTITLPPEIERTDNRIDWYEEGSRVAEDAAIRLGEEKEFRSLDRPPDGMGPPPPKDSRHKLGDSQHFEGGVIIDWVGSGCYYSNQDAPIAAFGQALRLQLLTCTGAGGGGGKPFPTIEEWKKERDER